MKKTIILVTLILCIQSNLKSQTSVNPEYEKRGFECKIHEFVGLLKKINNDCPYSEIFATESERCLKKVTDKSLMQNAITNEDKFKEFLKFVDDTSNYIKRNFGC
jgi:hypothetical protein